MPIVKLTNHGITVYKSGLSIFIIYVCVEDDEVNIGVIYTSKHFWAGNRILDVFLLDHPRPHTAQLWSRAEHGSHSTAHHLTSL